MLAPAPFQMPVEEDKAKSGETQSGFHPEGIPGTSPGGIKIPSSEDKSEGEVKVSSPQEKLNHALAKKDQDLATTQKKADEKTTLAEQKLASVDKLEEGNSRLKTALDEANKEANHLKKDKENLNEKLEDPTEHNKQAIGILVMMKHKKREYY
nr:uncharacterized protein LOC120970285 [Aegilops tauschii subsp. strangulata]